MTGNFTPMPIESQSMKTGVYASLRLLKIYSVTVLSICILIIHTGRKGFQLLSNDMKMAHNGSNYSTINKIHKSSLQKYLAYLSCSLKSHKRSTSEIPVYQTPKTYPLYLAAYIMVKEEMEKKQSSMQDQSQRVKFKDHNRKKIYHNNAHTFFERESLTRKTSCGIKSDDDRWFIMRKSLIPHLT